MKHILFILGTRPDVIKLAPLIKICKKTKGFKITVVNTGQHTELTNQALQLFNIRPDISLSIMKKNQDLFDITTQALRKLKTVYKKTKPDIAIVQGDTTTALTGALGAYYEKIPVGHVEAGLRTYDIYNPYPEEINRCCISQIASFHFVPTHHAKQNLIDERIKRKHIFHTGNTVVDAMQMISNKNTKQIKKEKIIFVTTHRRESFDKHLTNILYAISEIARLHPDFSLYLPVHPNPKVKKEIQTKLKNKKNITLLEPLSYTDTIDFLKRSYLVITDSGGIQEEAPTFHTPVLVVRNTTERPEGIHAGCAKLVGTDTQKIVSEVTALLKNKKRYKNMSHVKNPYGDGRASKRIITILKKHL